jgi:hypothetical protein
VTAATGPTAMARAPRATRAGRIAAYLGSMFPPLVTVPAGVANFLAISFALQALAGRAPLALGWHSACGAASVVLFALLLRVYDELKDAAGDLRLGRAGDPRYKDRPVVTGHVRVGDLVALRFATTIALVALNAPLGARPLAAFAVTLFLTWCSFKWYFLPAISKSLLLAFVTHNPLTLVISGYAAVVAAAEAGPEILTGWAVPLLLGLWAPVAAWETGRKVRLPPDETDYETYSRRLGWKTAALLPAGFVAVSLALLLVVARAAGLGWAFPAALASAGAVVIGACVLLRLAPTSGRANLRPFAEGYLVLANAGLALALALRHGVVLAR